MLVVAYCTALEAHFSVLLYHSSNVPNYYKHTPIYLLLLSLLRFVSFRVALMRMPYLYLMKRRREKKKTKEGKKMESTVQSQHVQRNYLKLTIDIVCFFFHFAMTHFTFLYFRVAFYSLFHLCFFFSFFFLQTTAM